MVIDIHAHVLRWPTLKKVTNSLTFMSAEEQIRRMDEKGIDKAVILPLTSAEVAGEHQSMGEVFSKTFRDPTYGMIYNNIGLLFFKDKTVDNLKKAENFYKKAISFDKKIPEAISRYQNECRRLYEVLDVQLKGKQWLCGEYSIADIANWSWVRIYKWSEIDISGLDNLRLWMDRMKARPACIKGVAIPPRAEESAQVKSAKSMIQK